jgi:hypothetical protein
VGHEEGEGTEEALDLLRFECLVTPRAHALQAEAVLVHPAGALLQGGRLRGECWRRREERGDDLLLLCEVALDELAPGLGILLRIASDVLDGLLDVPADCQNPAVREGMGVDFVRFDEIEAMLL